MGHSLTAYRIQLKTLGSKLNKEGLIVKTKKMEDFIPYNDGNKNFINFILDYLEELKGRECEVKLTKRVCNVESVYQEQTKIMGRPVELIYGLINAGEYGENSKIVQIDKNEVHKKPKDKEYIKCYFCFCFIKGSKDAFLMAQSKGNKNFKSPLELDLVDRIKKKYKDGIKINFKQLMPNDVFDKIYSRPACEIKFIQKGIEADEAKKLMAIKDGEDSNLILTENIDKSVTYKINETSGKNFFSDIKNHFVNAKNEFIYVEFLDFTPSDIKTVVQLENGKKKTLSLKTIVNSSRFAIDLSEEDIKKDEDGDFILEEIHNWSKEYLECFIR